MKSRKSIAEWRKRVGDAEADRISKQGTTRGTKFHKYTEDYLNNLDNKPHDIIQQMSKPWQLFLEARPYLDDINNIHALEAPLYSEYFGLAGRVDCIAEYKGELAIVDFKTSRKQKPEKWIEHYFVQCAAYGALYYDLTGIEVEKLVIIQACEDGEVQLFEKYDKCIIWNYWSSTLMSLLTITREKSLLMSEENLNDILERIHDCFKVLYGN